MKGILDFYDIIPASGFDVPAQEAIDRFRTKGLRPSFGWQDVSDEEHRAAFTVAKMMDVDLLADVKASLDDAIANGVAFRDWADNMIPFLQQRGWWGRQAVIDPVTGETIIAQLGSPARLQTIFRTNMASAYAQGHWDQIEAQAEDAPYLMYDAVDDFRTRPEHAAWDNIVLPVTDKFWKTHTPPCGWNCRCSVIQLDESDLEQLGITPDRSPRTKYVDWQNPRTGKTEKVPQGVDPGFGQAASDRVSRLQKLLKDKIAALPPDMEKAARKGIPDEPPAPPAKPLPAYKTFKPLKNVKEAEKWILDNVASSTGLPKSTKISGLNAIAQAVLEVNERFGMPKVRYIGDKNGDVNRYRLGSRATAAYAPGTDAFIVTARGTDDDGMRKRFSGDGSGYNQRVLLDILGGFRFKDRPGAQKVRSLVESELKSGINWSIVNDSRSLTMHEMGHRLHQFNRYQLDELGSQALLDGWPLLISRYGTTNRSEYIAEVFALYMRGDETQHWRIYPPLLDWLKRMDKELNT